MPLRPRLARLLSALASGDPQAGRRPVLLPGMPLDTSRRTAERTHPNPTTNNR